MTEAKFEKMLDQLEDELKGAEEYIKCAVANKTAMPEAFENYMRMANAEMEHANQLHSMIERMFERRDIPAQLQPVWEYQNERFMLRSKKIRTEMEVVRRN